MTAGVAAGARVGPDVPTRPVAGAAVWSADEIEERGGWLHVLHPDEIAELSAAADAVDAVAEELHIDIAFEAGDMQFLHNHTVMHSRRAFADFPEPERKRHLLRIWLLTYDGRPVPPVFYERNGSPATARRPGGIVGAATALRVPLEGL